MPSDRRSGATAGEQGLGLLSSSSSSSSSSFSSESPSEVVVLSDHARHTLADVLQFAGVGQGQGPAQGQGLDPGSGSGTGICPFTIPTTVHLHHRHSSIGADGGVGSGSGGRETTAAAVETTRTASERAGVGGDPPGPGSGAGAGRTPEGGGLLSVEETALRARLQLSQEMYHKLSVYFLPFTLRLMAVSTSSSTSSAATTQPLSSSPPPTLLPHTPSPSLSAATAMTTAASPQLDANHTMTESHTTGSSSTGKTTMGESLPPVATGNTLLPLPPLTTDSTTQPPSQSHPSSTSSATLSATSKTLTTPFFVAMRRHSNNLVSIDTSANAVPISTDLSFPRISGTSIPHFLDISVNFTEWNHRSPPAHLPLFPYGRNHSLTQLLWFENENLAYHSKSGFLAHLFPQVSE